MKNSITEILTDLKAQLIFRGIEIPSDNILKSEINKAIGAINSRRHFVPSDDKIYPTKYKYLIIPLCISSFAKVGIESETSHSENGVQRIYDTDSDYPQALLNEIVPLAK